MGNSPSSNSQKSKHQRSSSRASTTKQAPKPTQPQWDYGIKRSASTSRANERPSEPFIRDGFLAVPGLPGPGHRRSRSANAISRTPRHQDTEPPPPEYTPQVPEKVDLRPRSSVTATLGSSHTRVLQSPTDDGATSSSTSDRNFRSASYLNRPMRKETQENALEMLQQYDTVLIVDDSRSMRGSLWREATRALSALAEEASRYDADGLDIYFLNHKKEGKGMKNARQVESLFLNVQPNGITPIGTRLEKLMKVYLDRLERSNDSDKIKPVNYIVITDGAPTDDPESVIRAAAARMDRKNWPLTQVGIQFVQIGNSKKAAEYLRELDDELDGVRDIVDTTPYTGQDLSASMLIKILLGGINRRVDRKGAEVVLSV